MHCQPSDGGYVPPRPAEHPPNDDRPRPAEPAGPVAASTDDDHLLQLLSVDDDRLAADLAAVSDDQQLMQLLSVATDDELASMLDASLPTDIDDESPPPPPRRSAGFGLTAFLSPGMQTRTIADD